MKPILGSLGANTLVILTQAEIGTIRAKLISHHDQTSDGGALDGFNQGVGRGLAHGACVILTALESGQVQQALTWLEKTEGRASGVNALTTFRSGIARGTAHLEAEFKGLQEAKKRGK